MTTTYVLHKDLPIEEQSGGCLEDIKALHALFFREEGFFQMQHSLLPLIIRKGIFTDNELRVFLYIYDNLIGWNRDTMKQHSNLDAIINSCGFNNNDKKEGYRTVRKALTNLDNMNVITVYFVDNFIPISGTKIIYNLDIRNWELTDREGNEIDAYKEILLIRYHTKLTKPEKFTADELKYIGVEPDTEPIVSKPEHRTLQDSIKEAQEKAKGMR